MRSPGRTAATRRRVGSALVPARAAPWVRGLPGAEGKGGQAEHVFSRDWNRPASLSAFGSVTRSFVFSEDRLFLLVCFNLEEPKKEISA